MPGGVSVADLGQAMVAVYSDKRTTTEAMASTATDAGRCTRCGETFGSACWASRHAAVCTGSSSARLLLQSGLLQRPATAQSSRSNKTRRPLTLSRAVRSVLAPFRGFRLYRAGAVGRRVVRESLRRSGMQYSRLLKAARARAGSESARAVTAACATELLEGTLRVRCVVPSGIRKKRTALQTQAMPFVVPRPDYFFESLGISPQQGLFDCRKLTEWPDTSAAPTPKWATGPLVKAPDKASQSWVH